MGNFTPGEIVALLVGGMLALAGAISTIGGAVEKIAKAVRVAKAPNDLQNDRLNELEEWRKDVDRKLNADKQHLDNLDAGSRVTQLALLALLDHGIDGNNIDQMQHAKEELQNHLINR